MKPSALVFTLILTVSSIAPIRAAEEAPPADFVPFAGLSAQDACDKATLPPGFTLYPFAAEPDLVQPIAFCLDHRGRVWVAEGLTYPRRHGNPPADNRPAGTDRSQPTPDQLKDIFGGVDRILVFEDTDGDHKADKRTVFLENLNLVSGLEVGFGGVWIGAAPYLMFVPVNDWDHPVPAGDPRILLDGWNYTADTHETLNTFSWGPDGWLYGVHGVFCPSNVGKPGTPESERQWCDAGVWRYHPTRQVFEIFTEGGSNPWGFDYDEHGRIWAEMCVIPHLFQMIQGARIQRQGGQHYCVNQDEIARNERYRDPRSRKPNYPFAYADIEQHGDHVHWSGGGSPHSANARSDAAGGGHAHAGVMVYQGESWPAEYRGKIFIGNIHGQRINMDIPVVQGSGFVGHHGKDFINFNDTWSQTLNQQQDLDGSVYVIDWYDVNQCHHGREDGHDKSNGRIYKIVYKNEKVTHRDLAALSDADLVGLVPSKNEFLSRHARRVLQERAHAGTVPPTTTAALQRLLRDGSDTPAKLRALWALHLIGQLDAPTVIACLKSPEEYIRAWAIQLAFESQENLQRLVQQANDLQLKADPNPIQMAESDPSPVVRLYLASAAQRAPRENIRAEIVKALLQRGEDAGDHNLPLMIWFAMEPLVADHPREALLAAYDTPLPHILNFTTRRIAALGTPEARDLITEGLTQATDTAKQLQMLAGLSAALQGQRSVAMPMGWDVVESKLGASRDPDVRTLVETLSLTFGSAAARASLRETLADAKALLEARRAALDSLLGVKDPDLPPTLRALLKDAALRNAALRALAGYNDPATPEAILSVYNTLDAGQQRDALNTLVSRTEFASPLLSAIAAGKISSKDLTADVVRQLRNLKDTTIQDQVAKIYGTVREASEDKQKEIERYRNIYRRGGSQPGNAYSGRVVFDKVCAQCHTLFGTGGKVGPDITGANRGDLNYLLETIIDPNAVIPNEYRSTEVETKDGRLLTGIVKIMGDKSVMLQTANEMVTIPRDEIESMQQSQLSMMPEGLLEPLTDNEVRDLFYYLSRPGQVPAPKESASK